jgi:hypothetical protein
MVLANPNYQSSVNPVQSPPNQITLKHHLQVRYLVQKRGVNLSSILVFTYTKKAAREIKVCFPSSLGGAGM